jgi:hypothetical protein
MSKFLILAFLFNCYTGLLVKDNKHLNLHKLNNKTTQCKNPIIFIIGVMTVTNTLLLMAGDVHPNPGPNLDTMNICHSNIRSLRHPDRLDHIRCELAQKFDLITISETWLKDCHNSDDYNIAGYQPPFRKDRIDNSGYGGVLVWAQNELRSKRRQDLETIDLELLWLEINTKQGKVLLGTIYRPPNSRNKFWTDLESNLVSVLDERASRIVIIGER